MTLENGTLEITGGSTVNAASFTVSHADIVLRPGSSAFINARDVDISHGFIFDMQKQLPWASSPQSSRGISISAADSFTLGGSVGILDNGVSADYFYADNSWAQKRVFIVLTDSDKTHEGDFSGPYSLATGSEDVDSPYAYTGTWEPPMAGRGRRRLSNSSSLSDATPGKEDIQEFCPSWPAT